MLPDPATLAQRRLCIRRTWQGLCPARSPSGPGLQNHVLNLLGRGGNGVDTISKGFLICFFTRINVVVTKLHNVITAALIGYWRDFAWTPASWDLPYSCWCFSLGLQTPHSSSVINLELLHFVLDTCGHDTGLLWSNGAASVLCCACWFCPCLCQ